MKLRPFLMERWQSVYEHQVACNLSESGVHPMSLRELLAINDGTVETRLERLLDTDLGYSQGNGSIELRERIAAIYPGAELDSVLVTHGGAEANFLATLRLLESGDEVVIMLPNYMQIHGLVPTWGGSITPWNLVEKNGWEADLGELERLVTDKTKLILITNPNNPTGRCFDSPFLDRLTAIAGKVGAWVLADEIYRGAEVDGNETPSVWGRYERVLVTSGLSKAYGLPGLRAGWVVSPDIDFINTLWSYHDYSSICSSPLTMALAAFALEPKNRSVILERTRGIIRGNLPIIDNWASRRPDRFSYRPPDAGAILYLRYHHAIGSTELAEKIRTEEGTLVVPGDHFGMESFLRLGFGSNEIELRDALQRVEKVLDGLSPQ